MRHLLSFILVLLLGQISGGPNVSKSGVYSTKSSSTNASMSATTMLSTTGEHAYWFGWTISLTAQGVACTGSTTVQINAIFTDPNSASPVTEALGTVTIAASGIGTLGFVANGMEHLDAASGTAVQYSTVYNVDSTCTTNPSYQLTPSLVQIW